MSRLDWLSDGYRVNWPGALAVALLIAVLAGIIFFGITSTAAFGPFNPSWEGTSDLREQIEDDPATELTIATDTAAYDTADAEDTVAFVVAPDEEYDDAATSQVVRFVERGGTLVVMENFETPGDALLDDVGANARIDGRLVRDEHDHDGAPTLPLATTVENHTLTTGVDQLRLNYASAVEPNNATVLVATGPFGYLTVEDEPRLDDDTELGTYPVATVEDRAAGTVIAISDPSIAINVMADRPDNAQFLQNIYHSGDHVIIDRSHTAGLPPFAEALLVVRDSLLIQAVLGGLLVVLFALAAERRLWAGLSGRLSRSGGDVDSQNLSHATTARETAVTRPDPDDRQRRHIMTTFNQNDTKPQDSNE